MELPQNAFKRAHSAPANRRSVCGPACRPATRWRSSPAPASTGCCSTASTRRTTSNTCSRSCRPRRLTHRIRRARSVERHGEHRSACSTSARSRCSFRMSADGGRGAKRGGGHALPAGGRARRRRHHARDAFRARQGIRQARARGNLRAGAGGDPSRRSTSIEAICAVDGVDGVFIGPADLHASMGHAGETANPTVLPLIDDAIRRIRKAGKAPGYLTAQRSRREAHARRAARCSSPSAPTSASSRAAPKRLRQNSNHETTKSSSPPRATRARWTRCRANSPLTTLLEAPDQRCRLSKSALRTCAALAIFGHCRSTAS